MKVLKSFHTLIKYNYHAQDEWNEVQSWSQPQPITNQDYEHINMVVMRFNYISAREVANMTNYDVNGMWQRNKNI